MMARPWDMVRAETIGSAIRVQAPVMPDEREKSDPAAAGSPPRAEVFPPRALCQRFRHLIVQPQPAKTQSLSEKHSFAMHFKFKSLLNPLVLLPCLLATSVNAATTSLNSGSLGAAANGTSTPGVVQGLPGPLAAAGDGAAGYSGGERTTVAYHPELNPAASSPFTIEFWARPTASDNDDTPISNRYATGNRSGWTFFQREPNTGWNFRMYSGDGGNSGWDLTGGTSTLGVYSHVVATWTGSTAQLYVNGVLVDDTNAGGLSGIYNPNSASISPVLSIGANFDGGSPSNAYIDEVAFYPTALTPAQIAAHYATAGSAVPGAYASLVKSDGALLYLQNIPEPSSVLLLGVAALGGLARRRR